MKIISNLHVGVVGRTTGVLLLVMQEPEAVEAVIFADAPGIEPDAPDDVAPELVPAVFSAVDVVTVVRVAVAPAKDRVDPVSDWLRLS